MKYEKYLPVGTVVMLKGGTKRAMIIGFCAYEDNERGKLFDYTGCLYPEGLIASNQTLLFDHSQIDKIYHIGLVDDEEKEFKEKLNKFVQSMNTTNPDTTNK